MDLSFEFSSAVWLWRAEKAAWHFVTLPEDQSEEIRFFNENNTTKKRGWGAVKVQVTIGDTTWETSIFPNKELNAYILLIKMSIRQAENIEVGREVAIAISTKV